MSVAFRQVPTPVPLPAPTPAIANQTSSVSLNLLPSLSPLSGSETASVASPSSSSGATPGSIPGLPLFKFVYLIPVIAVVGVILIIALVWLIQGCATRKPRVKEEDPEVLGGPRYEFIEPGARPQLDGDGDKYDEATHLGYENVRWEDEPSVLSGRMHSAVPPPVRDAMSADLMEMYESDEEQDNERRHQEPWETLRHRSIKRGILAHVQKEEGWIDSLRAVAGSAFVNQGPPPKPPRRRASEVSWIDEVKQRRARSKASRTNTANPPPVSAAWSAETGFKIVQESPDIGGPQVHRAPDEDPYGTRGRGKAAIRDYFNYKLPPAGASSRVPVDQTIRVGGKDTRVSMLPLSPPRIMSPELDSQLLFNTPVPGTAARMESPPPAPMSASSNGRLFTRLTDRKRKPSAGVNVDQPLPYPSGEVVAPLRPGKKTGKLTKSRTSASAKYQPIGRGAPGPPAS
ncbi:hypothetical protein DFP72DRAFT_898762 [Ephemerocybe angulata]|uniref:Uncharacterized protein n=1 Tax=Ephemerocybe angulata TaxID=980116 RepID=A0A8H6HX05_9AGAR|nr:hypothetical protein DFP72DRAFT_898762 [Tulosesus angulatus]